jgi:hypothetical protein
MIAMLLRLAGRLACVIVFAWFAVFAVHQTSVASAHQAAEVSNKSATGAPEGHPGTIHRLIDEAGEGLTSPFSAVTSGMSSQWEIHIVDLLLALLLYGLLLGYIARMISVRV